jgi:hypothetical protein
MLRNGPPASRRARQMAESPPPWEPGYADDADAVVRECFLAGARR